MANIIKLGDVYVNLDKVFYIIIEKEEPSTLRAGFSPDGGSLKCEGVTEEEMVELNKRIAPLT